MLVLGVAEDPHGAVLALAAVSLLALQPFPVGGVDVVRDDLARYYIVSRPFEFRTQFNKDVEMSL